MQRNYVLISLLSLLLLVNSLEAQISQIPSYFYPYGIANGDNKLGCYFCNEGPIPFTFKFFNVTYDEIVPHMNGHITLGEGGYDYGDHNSLDDFYEPSIVPYYGNIEWWYDQEVYYRVTENTNLLNQASEFISSTQKIKFIGTQMAIITWINITPVDSSSVATFQTILIRNKYYQSFVIFNYGNLEWDAQDMGFTTGRDELGWVASMRTIINMYEAQPNDLSRLTNAFLNNTEDFERGQYGQFVFEVTEGVYIDYCCEHSLPPRFYGIPTQLYFNISSINDNSVPIPTISYETRCGMVDINKRKQFISNVDMVETKITGCPVKRSWTIGDYCWKTNQVVQELSYPGSFNGKLDIILPTQAESSVECEFFVPTEGSLSKRVNSDPFEGTEPPFTGIPNTNNHFANVSLTYQDYNETYEFSSCLNRSSKLFATKYRLWTAKDDCGNTATKLQTIRVLSRTPPTILPGDPHTLECGSNDFYEYFNNDLLFGCGHPEWYPYEKLNNKFEANYCNSTIQIYVRDPCGNGAVVDTSLTVVDTNQPYAWSDLSYIYPLNELYVCYPKNFTGSPRVILSPSRQGFIIPSDVPLPPIYATDDCTDRSRLIFNYNNDCVDQNNNIQGCLDNGTHICLYANSSYTGGIEAYYFLSYTVTDLCGLSTYSGDIVLRMNSSIDPEEVFDYYIPSELATLPITTSPTTGQVTTSQVTSASVTTRGLTTGIYSDDVTTSIGLESNNANEDVPAGTIAGTVIAASIGGLLLFGTILATIFFCRKKQYKYRRGQENDEEDEEEMVESAQGGVVVSKKRRRRRRREEEETSEETTETSTQISEYSESASEAESEEIPNESQGTKYESFDINIPLSNQNPQEMSPSKDRYLIDFNEIKMKNKLGSGAFGIVFKGIWRGSPIAVKQLSNLENLTEKEINEFKREISVMSNLRPHKNVIALFGYCSEPLCIITEFCDGGALHSLLHSTSEITNETKIKFARGIAAGMMHLHEENIVHRDLAARNILLNNNEVKVSDFGMSRLSSKEVSNQTTTTVGPLKWMSPESLNSRIYSSKTDVYSYGCTLFEIITRRELYEGEEMVSVAIRVARGEINLLQYFPKDLTDYPPILYSIMKDCLQFNPENRPDFSAVLKQLP